MDKELTEFAEFVADRILRRYGIKEIPDYYFLLFQYRHPELSGIECAEAYGKYCIENKYPQP